MLKLKANKEMVQCELDSSTGKVATMKDLHNIAKPRTQQSDTETLSSDEEYPWLVLTFFFVFAIEYINKQ